MSSPVARPIRSSSKKLTSSTCSSFSHLGWVSLCGGEALDLFDAAGLPAGQVDPELLSGPEHVLVAVLHLDGDAVAGQHLDVEAQRLELLEQDLERLRD